MTSQVANHASNVLMGLQESARNKHVDRLRGLPDRNKAQSAASPPKQALSKENSARLGANKIQAEAKQRLAELKDLISQTDPQPADVERVRRVKRFQVSE